ncbi:MAG: glycosyltransferase family 39 protein [Reichenbachiella sp.]
MKLNNEKFVLITLISVQALIHLWAIVFEGYGIFRDELYYLSCADHLAFGYVDHPPFSIWVLKLYTSIFGDHWAAIRVVPMAVSILSTYLIVKCIGSLKGDALAKWIAGVAFIAAPINMAFTSYYSMNAFEICFWLLGFYQMTKVLNHPKSNITWIWFGVIIGAGMMNKISMTWFAIGFVLYLVISPDRKLLVTTGPYLSGIVALLIFSPFLIWNYYHDWAHLEFAKNASTFKYSGISRMDFLSEQLLLENPYVLILLLGSALFLFSKKYAWQQKAPMVLFVSTISILLLKGNVKSEYMASSYAAVFISGSIYLSDIVNKRWQINTLKIYAIFYLLTGLFLVPLACPMLPAQQFIIYQQFLGLSAKNTEGKKESALPQFFADMHGWETIARTVAIASNQLTKFEKQNVVIVTNNYGEASAMAYYQEQFDLPPAVSKHNNHYLWGKELTENRQFDVFIVIGDDPDHLRDLFEVVEEHVTQIECGYCMPYENNQAIHIVKKARNDVDIMKDYFSEKNYN